MVSSADTATALGRTLIAFPNLKPERVAGNLAPIIAQWYPIGRFIPIWATFDRSKLGNILSIHWDLMWQFFPIWATFDQFSETWLGDSWPFGLLLIGQNWLLWIQTYQSHYSRFPKLFVIGKGKERNELECFLYHWEIFLIQIIP